MSIRLQPPGRRQEQRRGVAAPVGHERELGADQLGAGPPELVEWSGFGHAQHAKRRAEHARPHRGRGRIQRPADPARRLRRQSGRPLEERGGGGQATADLRPAGRTFQFHGDLLVRLARGQGAVPGTAVRIGRRVRDVGQRSVHVLPFGQRRGPVGGRADQRVPEPYPGADLGQASLGRRLRGGSGIPSCPAARHTSAGSPAGSAAATASNSRV